MRIHITGEVTGEMIEEENSTKYHISANGTEYEVVARGGQAFKDYVFVRKHQQMEIEGILEAKRIFLEKAKIRLREKRNQETNEGGRKNESAKRADRGSGELQERK